MKNLSTNIQLINHCRTHLHSLFQVLFFILERALSSLSATPLRPRPGNHAAVAFGQRQRRADLVTACQESRRGSLQPQLTTQQCWLT